MPTKKKVKTKASKKLNFLSFQDIIMNLQKFWGKNGCVILQPYDLEVGAGTFHPATTLRSLGPKPWKAAYVQPSRRPTDGRYGENPNRLQHYYQFQDIYSETHAWLGVPACENSPPCLINCVLLRAILLLRVFILCRA